jgi:uncharacterized protein YbjQ (UPF0145 family)
MLVLTIDHVPPGHRVDHILGEVIGVTIRRDNPYVEGAESLNGDSNPHIRLLVRTRQEAVAGMVAHARSLGANAIVGMRFDHRTIGKWNEICAYGTAMLLSPTPPA